MLYFNRKPGNEKEAKNLTIFNILREKGEVFRSEISELTNINVVSISNYINAFIKKGLVIEKKIGESSGGRPPIILNLNKDDIYAMGIYVRDATIFGTMVNSELKVMNKRREELKSQDIGQSIIDMANLTRGDVDDNKIKGLALISDDIDVVDLESKIKDKIKWELYTEDPGLPAAYVEVLSLDTSHNRVLYSHGDIGYCVLYDNESFYTSKDTEQKDLAYLRPWNRNLGITPYVKKIVEKGVGTEIISLTNGLNSNITLKMVIEAAKKNDNVAVEILEFVGLNLGVRLAYLINIFRPQKLIIGGGVEKAEEFFIGPLKKSIERLAQDEALKGLDIKRSSLDEEVVAAGAAALIIREIFMEA